MMLLNSKHFGEIDFNEDDILKFPEGLPGFDNEKEFALLNFDKDEFTNFYFLQSVKNKELAFVAIDAMLLLTDYDPIINKEDISSIGSYETSDLVILNICVVPDDFYKTTVNLCAPVVINLKTKLCKQTTVDNYDIRHYLFNQEVQKDGE